MAGLVDIQNRFMTEIPGGFTIGICQRLRNPPRRLGNLPPADRSLTNILQKSARREIGGMRLDVQKGQGGRKMIADKSLTDNLSGQFPPMESAARRTTAGRCAKFPADDRIVAKINLLPHHTGRRIRVQISPAAAGHGGRFESRDFINLF
jgi:hypothetical protein